MDNQLFRQKSLDRISSPEELHDYMRVTSPRLWMILTAIVVLLAGFLIYASTVTMENTLPIRVTISSYKTETTGGATETAKHAESELPLSLLEKVRAGMKVRIGTIQGKIEMVMTTEEKETITVLIYMDEPVLQLADGEYDAVLVLEETTPISFLWN